MKKVKLTQRKYTLIDDRDFKKVNEYKWCATKGGSNIFYAVRRLTISKNKIRLFYLHHAILGKKKNKVVDHINGNSLDNRRSNLQFVTYSQNSMKRHNRSHNKSGYRGVYLHNRGNRWIAQIRLKNKSFYIGSFINKKDAALAFNKMAKKFYKKFAVLNKI